MKENTPTLTLVIPTFNSTPWIDECLDAVARLEYPADKLEVVVVDNGSTDETVARVRAAGREPVFCAKRGPAAARNEGVRRARGEIVAFIDSDTVPDPRCLLELARAFEDGRVGGVGGRIDPQSLKTGPELHAWSIGVLNQEAHLASKSPYAPPFVATANAAFRREALLRIGGFDESLRVGEDADLCWRLQWEGWLLKYAPEAKVRHHHRSGKAAYFRQVFQYGQGTVHLFAKHRRRLGRSYWIEWPHYGRILSALVHIPLAPLTAREPWRRVMPVYDLCVHLCWLAGRVVGSVRHRVVAL
jgi:cellulose synthase/poly-beta-1,6-N-acetylglucosamine synthase-like glycosyltransferase